MAAQFYESNFIYIDLVSRKEDYHKRSEERDVWRDGRWERFSNREQHMNDEVDTIE